MKRDYIWSCVVSVGMVLVANAMPATTPPNPLMWLFAPGMLLAALLFPQGIHGDWPNAYLTLALGVDTLVLAWPVLGVWRIVRRLRKRRRPQKGVPGGTV